MSMSGITALGVAAEHLKFKQGYCRAPYQCHDTQREKPGRLVRDLRKFMFTWLKKTG